MVEAIRVDQEAMKVSLDLPGTPDMSLAMNRILHGGAKMPIQQLRGMHYAKVRKAKEQYAMEIMVALQRQDVQDWKDRHLPPVRVLFVVRYKDQRKRDADGILQALKHCIDALVSPCGLLQDDGPPIVQELSVKVLLGQHRDGTEIVMEEVR